MKYTAINIGPIFKTLGMARKPRQLWAASYLFSHLMKHIYQEVEREGLDVISPAKPERENTKAGIYPDRIYVKGELDAKTILSRVRESFYNDLDSPSETKKNDILNYFNLMAVTTDKDKESQAIEDLNRKLDVMELCVFAPNDNADDIIYELITDENFGLRGDDAFKAIDLGKIANAQRTAVKKSYQKYFCVVQADGDNVGKTVSHKSLPDGEIKKISTALVNFGLDAISLIEKFGGYPIYAGGDDLLFISPVVGKDNNNIFQLLDQIESLAFKGVRDIVNGLNLKDDKGSAINASLSFGVSITYHKYPLYEALEKARELLFDKAKKEEHKNAIAWSLRKHSGGTFEACFSRKDSEMWDKFTKLIAATTDKDTVSAVAHKIREKESLVEIVLASKETDRLDALFDKVLEFDNDKKDYFNAVKALMPVLYKRCEDKEGYAKMLYSLLRTAKFIKGEDLQ